MNANVRNLLIATVLAMMALFLTLTYINNQKAAIQKGQQRVQILVASQNIPAGTTAGEIEKDGGMVSVKSVLKDDVVPGAMDAKNLADLKDTDALKVQVLEGAPLSTLNFDAEAKLPASDQLRGTERWIAVPAGNVQNVAQHVRPGDHIDIHAIGVIKNFAVRDAPEIPASWIAARDVLVVETPQSREAKLGEVKEEEAGTFTETPTADSGKVDAPTGIYVLQVSDKVASEIYYALNVAAKGGGDSGKGNLFFALRGRDGATQTSIPVIDSIPNVK